MAIQVGDKITVILEIFRGTCKFFSLRAIGRVLPQQAGVHSV